MKQKNTLTPTSYAMLGLLARSPQSAYELNARMQTSLIRVFWPRTESAVYTEPRKLLLLELVTEHREKVRGRKRTVYTITEKGREALSNWLGSSGSQDLRTQAEFVLKLILVDGGKVGDARETLKESLAATRADMEEAVAGIVRILSDPDYRVAGAPYTGIAINLMADILIARHHWGSFALAAAAEISDDSSAEEKQATGRTAYAEALRKLELAMC